MTRLEGVGDYKQVINHTSHTPSNLLKPVTTRWDMLEHVQTC